MNIQIRVTATQPPSGEVLTDDDGDEARGFTGWLQLLRILADILATDASSEPERSEPERSSD